VVTEPDGLGKRASVGTAWRWSRRENQTERRTKRASVERFKLGGGRRVDADETVREPFRVEVRSGRVLQTRSVESQSASA